MLCTKKECTGCYACYNICPKKAIYMKEDDNGFIYPEIDKNKCIDCKLCENACPSIHKIKKNTPKKCYAMYSKNNNVRKKSTSGGIATIFSTYIINNKGIVYGASYNKECTVGHIRVDNVNDLHKLQGSKYVHSYIGNTYKLVKEDLKKDIQVLFIGTPCQVAGLKKFLGKDYEKLILVDIICHGVPSQRYLKEEVKRINNHLDIDRVNFRNGNKYGFFIIKNDEVIYETEIKKSPYCDSFMQALSLRENCYNCNYASPDRVSDITIGDFWGLDKSSKFYENRELGVSTVIISTDKGKKFVDECKDELLFEERDYNEAVKGNTQLRTPSPKNKNADMFKYKYKKYGFIKSYKKSTRLFRLKRLIKSIIKK